MSVAIEDVENIEQLAKLEFDQIQKEKLTSELNDVLNYFDKIIEIDSTKVKPTLHPVFSGDKLRSDMACPGLTAEEALSNAPDRYRDQFSVQKMQRRPDDCPVFFWQKSDLETEK